jgi:DNA repair photolyase
MRHGSNIDPPNRFESIQRQVDWEQLKWEPEYQQALAHRRIEYIEDASQSIVTENSSPDIPFRYSLNPYRGCAHACSYCYARPGHEYLGFNAGLDFETKIVIKREAPRLLREFLSKRNWKPEPITFSGVTDCYQPAERQLQLTRQCLEVVLECRQPVSLITKNALVLRDLDILSQLAEHQLVHVYLSITSLDPELARDMEPRTSMPEARLRAVQTLSQAGVPVGVMMAPIIPGLNDSQIPQLLQAVSDAGAIKADYTLLRLPLNVETVFVEWLQRVRPNHATKVLGRLEAARGGKRSSSTWGERMVGTGLIAEQIRNTFRVFRRKFGLESELPPHRCDLFRPPTSPTGQMQLF